MSRNPEDINKKKEEVARMMEEKRQLSQEEIDEVIKEHEQGKIEEEMKITEEEKEQARKTEEAWLLITKEVSNRVAEGASCGTIFLEDLALRVKKEYGIEVDVQEEIKPFVKKWEKKIRKQLYQDEEGEKQNKEELLNNLLSEKEQQVQSEGVIVGIVEKLTKEKTDVAQIDFNSLIENFTREGQQIDKEKTVDRVMKVKDIVETSKGYFSKESLTGLVRLVMEDEENIEKIEKAFKEASTQAEVDEVLHKEHIKKLSSEERLKEAATRLAEIYLSRKKCNTEKLAEKYMIEKEEVEEFSTYLRQTRVARKESEQLAEEFLLKKREEEKRREQLYRNRRVYLEKTVEVHTNVREIKDIASIKSVWKDYVLPESDSYNRRTEPTKAKFNGVPYQKYEEDIKKVVTKMAKNKKQKEKKSEEEIIREVLEEG